MTEIRIDDAAALQERLKKAGNNAVAFQQKTTDLFKTINNLKVKKEEALKSAAVKGHELAIKDREIERLEKDIENMKKSIKGKREMARHYKDSLSTAEEEFQALVNSVRDVARHTVNKKKSISTRLLIQDLEATRGYSCSRTSSMNSSSVLK